MSADRGSRSPSSHTANGAEADEKRQVDVPAMAEPLSAKRPRDESRTPERRRPMPPIRESSSSSALKYDDGDGEPTVKRARMHEEVDRSRHTDNGDTAYRRRGWSPDRSRDRSRDRRQSRDERRRDFDDFNDSAGRRRSSGGGGGGSNSYAADGDPRDARRKASVSQEERKRGQRLFGGLLSTLSQSSSSGGGRVGSRGSMVPGAERVLGASNGRERREQDRENNAVRQPSERGDRRQPREEQTPEERERQAARLEKLDRIRKIEQVKLDEQRMHTLQANELALARNLQTKSKPVLYYRPWELTREQEDIIDEQVHAAERRIAEQRRAFGEEKRTRLAALGVRYRSRETHVKVEKAPSEAPAHEEQGQPAEDAKPVLQDPDAMVDGVDAKADAAAEQRPESRSNGKEQHQLEDQEDRDHYDERDRDVMVEHEEDTVIY